MPRRMIQALSMLLVLAGAMPPVAAAPPTRSKPSLELKDGWYYLHGRKFLVNAIGYESGARPGEVPYEQTARNLAQVRRDLKVIRAAGFNGIRTWSQMSEAELKVVQASGLKVVFGIWLKPDEDFSDPKVVEKDLALIRQVLAYSRKYDCVITYLIMNEPMPEHLRKVGAQATRNLWVRATELIHQLHPGIPVTISGNTAITEWLDMNLFDVYGRNAYDYKDGANFTHGFANAQRAITATLGQGKPVLLTQFGRSGSRQAGGLYGGNSPEEQAETYGDRLWKRDPDACCGLRKVDPMRRALSSVDAWVAGIRRADSASRANTPKVAWDKKFSIWKFNPLADWSERDVWNHLNKHNVPYNPLHDQGYPSIGCTHCTRPVAPGQSARDGRWSGSGKTECGIN